MAMERVVERAARPFAGALGDLWGGLAAMLVAFPSSIAYGVVIFTAASPSYASAGALAGIVGAAILGIVAPLIGRNGGFITAPCAPAAAVLSGVAAEFAARGRSAQQIIFILALTAALSALLQVAYGLARAGRLIKYIPYQVVTGYLSGVAVIIAAAQLPRLAGMPSGAHVGETLISPQLWRWEGIVVGAVVIAVMALAPRLTRAVPPAVLGLSSGIAAYFLIAAARPSLLTTAGNPLVIGPVRAAGSFLSIITDRANSVIAGGTADFAAALGPALTLSVLLSIDTLKTGVVLDALTRRRHNSNRELIAQGFANAASFVGGGIPGAATMGPTLVNVTSGGRSPLSGVIEGALVLAAFLALGQLIAWVPIAALAGILLMVAWRMFDFQMFHLLTVPSTRLDFVVIVAVVIVAASIGLIEAAAVGVGLAILLFIRNQMRGSVVLRRSEIGELRSKRRRTADEAAILADAGSAAVVVQLQGDLFFGTTDQLFSDLERDLSRRRFILFDLRRVQSMDYTAAHLFTQMQQRLRESGGQMLFSGVPSKIEFEHYMDRLGLLGRAGIPTFDTRDSALEWMEDRLLDERGSVPAESRPPLQLEEIALFRSLDPAARDQIAGVVEETEVAPGTKIFSAGDAGDEIYFVRSGRVHVLLPLESGKRHHLATICRGEFFGEMAFLDRGHRSAEAEAATPTRLFVISRQTFDGFIARNEMAAGSFYQSLALATAQRLRQADAELRALEER